MQLRAAVAAANIGGTIHIAVLPTASAEGSKEDDVLGKIVGVAVWFAPGQSINTIEEQRAAGWNAFMDAVSEETKRWWLEYFIPTLSRTTDDVFGEGTVLQAWDLHLFGVLPEYQGKGIAGALMHYADSLAEKTGAPMVLETQKEENVVIYSKLD
ncbi:hypothetical protein NMY22_g7059 [Coprinellus aureogranulatus]|nr:hypothetical protein NMY22_g7059 [Coprinellus aureogranulatus]